MMTATALQENGQRRKLTALVLILADTKLKAIEATCIISGDKHNLHRLVPQVVET